MADTCEAGDGSGEGLESIATQTELHFFSLRIRLGLNLDYLLISRTHGGKEEGNRDFVQNAFKANGQKIRNRDAFKTDAFVPKKA